MNIESSAWLYFTYLCLEKLGGNHYISSVYGFWCGGLYVMCAALQVL